MKKLILICIVFMAGMSWAAEEKEKAGKNHEEAVEK